MHHCISLVFALHRGKFATNCQAAALMPDFADVPTGTGTLLLLGSGLAGLFFRRRQMLSQQHFQLLSLMTKGGAMKKISMLLAILVLVFALASAAGADSYTISAAQVKEAMADYGAPLSDSTYLWGLWAVRTMPIVTGGGYTITGGSTSQTGWGVSAPSSYSWHAPYGSNCAWFYDIQGGTYDGDPNANPLYMIIDQPASSFTSYFGNTVTAVDDSSIFTINFTLDPGASWSGQFQFVVDGSKYYGGGGLPAQWVEDFFGDYSTYNWHTGQYETGGGLASNLSAGYQVPLPGAVWLLGSGLAGLGFLRRRQRMS